VQQASHVSALRHCRPVWSMYVSSFVSRILEIGTYVWEFEDRVRTL